MLCIRTVNPFGRNQEGSFRQVENGGGLRSISEGLESETKVTVHPAGSGNNESFSAM